VKPEARDAWTVAPLAATTAFWALCYIASTIQVRSLPFNGDPGAAVGTLLIYLLIGLPVAYLATFALAYPVFLALERRGRLTKRAIILAAAVVGVAVLTTPTMVEAAEGRFNLEALLIAVAFGILTGIVGGAVFVGLFPFESRAPLADAVRQHNSPS
jgi:H+/gluconate symporter-like permease